MIYIIDEIRTNNFTDEKLVENITGLYQRAFEKIGASKTDLYGIYHQYAGNYRDDYTLSLGTTLELGSETIEIPDIEYRIFEVNPSLENAVVKMWQHIWQMEAASEISRAYDIDYEKYNVDGTIQIYIGLK